MPPVEARTLTLSEVAEQLSVSRRCVLDRVRAGRLRALRLSPRTIRIRQEDLDVFLERARRAAER